MEPRSGHLASALHSEGVDSDALTKFSMRFGQKKNTVKIVSIPYI